MAFGHPLPLAKGLWCFPKIGEVGTEKWGKIDAVCFFMCDRSDERVEAELFRAEFCFVVLIPIRFHCSVDEEHTWECAGSGAKSALWLVHSFVCERTRALKLDSALIRKFVRFHCSVHDHTWRGVCSGANPAPWRVCCPCVSDRTRGQKLDFYFDSDSIRFLVRFMRITRETARAAALLVPSFVRERSGKRYGAEFGNFSESCSAHWRIRGHIRFFGFSAESRLAYLFVGS